MFVRTLTVIGFALTIAQAPATAADISLKRGIAKAVNACVAANQDGDVDLVDAVKDGMGDYLVWLKDSSERLWMCNANPEGAVYANTAMEGDLLKGAGPDLIGFQSVSSDGKSGAEPAKTAEQLCTAVGQFFEDLEVVTTADDGIGDTIVWLRNSDKKFWICNASSDAKLYVFQPVEQPLNDFTKVTRRSA